MHQFKCLKKMILPFLVCTTILGSVTPIYADEVKTQLNEDNIVAESNLEVQDNANAENVETFINDEETDSNMDRLNSQLNVLYKRIGNKLNLDYKYIKIIHMIAGGKAVYADELPDIYSDLTIENLNGPFDIDGVNQEYKLKADWVKCEDEAIELSRPNKYYLPDAAYNVAKNVVDLMSSRASINRGENQNYFNALSSDVKTELVFTEALLIYTGCSETAINNYFNAYCEMVKHKQAEEFVLVTDESGSYYFKPEYATILNNNGIKEPKEYEVIGTVLRFDSTMAQSSGTNDLTASLVLPYELNVPTRENMMLAATSLVGKVRYVWGGGHGAQLEGINPIWSAFSNAYTTDDCIRPNHTWCPIHGYLSYSTNACLFDSSIVYSADEYLQERRNQIDLSTVDIDQFYSVLDSINMSNGITSHRLDGLDCSGFTSWLFNQVTDEYHYDTFTTDLVYGSGVDELEYEADLLPGDVYAWSSHIIAIIGKINDNSDVYVTVESTPDVLRFGVAYYSGADYSDINYASQVASEANLIFGGLDGSQSPATYNMSSIGGVAGRMKIKFNDEDTIIESYGRSFEDLNAVEILQHCINKYSLSWLTGYSEYNGEIFSIPVTSNSLVVNLETKEGNIEVQPDQETDTVE